MRTASLQTCTFSIGKIRTILRAIQSYILLGALEIMVMLPPALSQFLSGFIMPGSLCLLLILAFYLTLKREAICSSETLVDFKLHSVTTQNSLFLIVTTVTASNPTSNLSF
jgi:hypothetical protein